MVSEAMMHTAFYVRPIMKVVGIIACICLASACGAPSSNASKSEPQADGASSSRSTGGNDGVSSAAPGQKLAGNMNDYIDQLLTWASKDEKPVLERAKKNGGLSASDYEKAWSDYKSCMVSRGYKPFELIKWPNGVYEMPSHMVGTQKQEEKYAEDYHECYGKKIMAIDTLYTAQVGNPSLYADQTEGVADCLKRSGAVSMDFSISTFKSEIGSGKYSQFDIQDPKVRACFAANDWHMGLQSDPYAQLW